MNPHNPHCNSKVPLYTDISQSNKNITPLSNFASENNVNVPCKHSPPKFKSNLHDKIPHKQQNIPKISILPPMKTAKNNPIENYLTN
jgi:hypothetical protein